MPSQTHQDHRHYYVLPNLLVASWFVWSLQVIHPSQRGLMASCSSRQESVIEQWILHYHVSLGMPSVLAVFRRVYIQSIVQDLKDQCQASGWTHRENFPSTALEWGVRFPMDELWMLKMIREVYSASKGLQKGPGNGQGHYFMLKGWYRSAQINFHTRTLHWRVSLRSSNVMTNISNDSP